MTSGPSASGSPGGAPRRFGYREWPGPSPGDGSSPPNSPGDTSPPTESSRFDNYTRSYEMSDRGASGRSRASSAPSANLTRPSSRSRSRPPSPASSSLGAWPPSPALHIRPLPRSPSSSSSFYGFSDAPAVPQPRPILQSGPPAIPPRVDQFNYLPQRPTFFRYATQSSQTPISGFFNPRPIVFDQSAQTVPSPRHPVRQGPRSSGPLEGHQQSPGAAKSPTTLPGYSRAMVAVPRLSPVRPLVIPSAFRPLVRGMPTPKSVPKPIRLPVVAPPESPPPRVWTISPLPSGASLPQAQLAPRVPPTDPLGLARPARPAPPVIPRSEPPPPPYEVAMSWPAPLRFIEPAAVPTTTSSASSSAAELGTPPRNAPPLWPLIPPLTTASTPAGSTASSSTPANTTSSATSPTYAAVVSGAMSASPGGSASSGLLARVTSPPATTTTAPSSSSPLSTQVLSQSMLFLYLFSWLYVRSLCTPFLTTPLFYRQFFLSWIEFSFFILKYLIVFPSFLFFFF